MKKLDIKSYVKTLSLHMEFCHDKDKVEYGLVNTDGRIKVVKINSSEFESEVRRIAYEKLEVIVNKNTVNEVVAHCKALASFGSQIKIYSRYAHKNGTVYVDLVNSKGGLVKIDESGWKIVRSKAVNFYRPDRQKELIRPVEGKGLVKLKKMFPNIEMAEFKLILSWMVSVIHNTGPFPILVIQGTQGSAKSFLMEVIRDLLDPVKAPLLTLPKSERDLVLIASNNAVIAFDNVSSLPKWLPDALCRISTGGGLSTRKLYSDNEEMIFEFCRPIMINGIQDIVLNNDLVDRSIIINMQGISKKERLTKKELLVQYVNAKPEILGSLYSAVAFALKSISSVNLKEIPRMADFAVLSCAVAPRFKWSADKFLAAYEKNQNQLSEVCFDSDIVASAVYKFMIEKKHWQGDATDLFTELTSFDSSLEQSRFFPGTVSKLRSRFRAAIPALAVKGVEVKRSRTSTKRLIEMELTEEESD